mmetsp:Transcript_8203/g.12703  ORF Transcript_8203/g.12703 Transcript_8203/m.12703 type:complete len:242 (+) Transcript_8203:1513-2238(+)
MRWRICFLYCVNVSSHSRSAAATDTVCSFPSLSSSCTVPALASCSSNILVCVSITCSDFCNNSPIGDENVASCSSKIDVTGRFRGDKIVLCSRTNCVMLMVSSSSMAWLLLCLFSAAFTPDNTFFTEPPERSRYSGADGVHNCNMDGDCVTLSLTNVGVSTVHGNCNRFGLSTTGTLALNSISFKSISLPSLNSSYSDATPDASSASCSTDCGCTSSSTLIRCLFCSNTIGIAAGTIFCCW